jgi:alkanesulfonate monooxygenase SsuD/methylene tetrahydromethanopterin reductase-like flavin-dependent oxidoreductase (luciferase family)
MKLRQRDEEVGYMPQRISHRHEIDSVIGKWQLLGGSLDQRYVELAPGDGEHRCADVDTDDFARLSRNCENLTVRQLAQRLGGFSGLAMVGTPAMIADQMEEWLLTEGSDGFTVQFPYLPGGLDDFVERVVPELQRRGIFRRDYEGKTLRENLGLPRPKNQFF